MDKYNKVAFCTEVSPADENFFKKMADDGVKAAIINLTMGVTGFNHQAKAQYELAKKYDMVPHLFHLAMFDSLNSIEKEARWFSSLAGRFDQQVDTVMTVAYNPREDTPKATAYLDIFLHEMYQFGNHNLDVCVPVELILNGNLDPSHLSYRPNLTVIDYDKLSPRVTGTGTWVYTNKFYGQPQLLAYDFFDRYVRPNKLRGVQLSLDDNYVARPGDNWWLVAEQLGIPLTELLQLNRATVADKIVPGKHIKIA